MHNTYSDWQEFDPEEYAWRCYGKRIMAVDRELINGVIRTLKRMDVQPGTLQRVADVGAGPNLFPSMILAPFVVPKEQGGQLDLIEYSQPNLDYLRGALAGRPVSPPAYVWKKYEALMAGHSPIWKRALDNLMEVASAQEGDIFALPPETYDAACAFFVAESITDSMEECEKAIESLLSAVKPSGLVVVGHMLKSTGYPAGAGTYFPGVPLTTNDLRRMYAAALEDMTIIEPPLTPEVHSDYHGAAVVIGKKAQKPRPVPAGSDTEKAFTAYDTQTCLYDEARVNYFKQAIFETVRPGDVVVDAGSGTGVLGLIAAQAGAAKVYCIEINPEYAEIIRENAKGNGMQDQIIVLQGDATEMTPPEPVDVIISEVISGGFFYEPQLQILHNLRRFLKKDGRVVPAAMDNFVELVDAQDELYGLTFRNDTRHRQLNDTALTTRTKYLRTDFSNPSPFEIAAAATVRCITPARANAIRIPYTIHFSSGVLGTQPTEFLLNPQVIFLREPLWLQTGAYYEVSFAYQAAASPLTCLPKVRLKP